MSEVYTVWLCPEHGAGVTTEACCKEGENMGWMEYKGAAMAENQDD